MAPQLAPELRHVLLKAFEPCPAFSKESFVHSQWLLQVVTKLGHANPGGRPLASFGGGSHNTGSRADGTANSAVPPLTASAFGARI